MAVARGPRTRTGSLLPLPGGRDDLKGIDLVRARLRDATTLSE